MLAMTAVSTMLAFVTTYKAVRPSAPPTKPGHEPIQRKQLTALETAVESLSRDVEKLGRTVERNASASDDQYYGAPLRIGVTALLMAPEGVEGYAEGVAQAANQFGAIARWVATIQNTNPDLAYRLGERMNEPLDGVADRLNEAMATGAPVRVVLTEFRATLESLSSAISAELDQRTN